MMVHSATKIALHTLTASCLITSKGKIQDTFAELSVLNPNALWPLIILDKD